MRILPDGVSNDYPNQSRMIPFNLRLLDRSFRNLDREFFASLPGADCWGIYVRRRNGEILPLLNTYALFEEIGKSFGLGHIRTHQYQKEEDYRNQVINDIDILLKLLHPGDSASIMMFGTRNKNQNWRVDAKRLSFKRIQYQAYATPELINSLRKQRHHQNKSSNQSQS